MTSFIGLGESAERVWRRLDLRMLAIAHAVGLLWFVLPLIWTMNLPNWPTTFVWSVAIITEVTVVFVLLAILIADEIVRRGAWPGLVYPAALVIAAVSTAVTQWYVRAWFGFQTFVNRPGVDAHRQLGQMLNMAIEVVIYGGLVVLIYVNRKRDLELTRAARDAELARAESEQALVQMRLATALVEVNPTELLSRLQRIHELFVVNSSVAEQALDEFTRELRTQLGKDGDRGEPEPVRATA